MRFAELDAVTIDGFGTLVGIADPVPPLARALRQRGFERSPETVARAFRAEVAYYRPRAATGRDRQSLAALRRECARIFLDAAGVPLQPDSFIDSFMAAIVLQPAPGALECAARLRSRGLELAVVSNWDVGLAELLGKIGAASLFTAIVTTAEADAPKDDPAIFRLALERLGVEPARALHVGDEPEDEKGAAAAGMRFAPAPLATAFRGWS
jgi:HAD superfamily hydrolase (TIGR01509 family)